MCPSRSAYTMFWAGTAKSAAAARNSSQFDARLRPRIASAVGAGSSAVHLSATAKPLPGSGPAGASALAPTVLSSLDTSESSGPCAVSRMTSSKSSPSATSMVSVRIASGRKRPSYSQRLPRTFSR